MTATPPRADLRTLAAEGGAPMTDQVAPSPQSLCDHSVYVHHVRGGEPLTIPLCQLCGEIGWDNLREQVAEHRRMVLAEAGEALERARQARIEADGHPIGSGWGDAEWVLDRLAAAAPETTLHGTEAAETAPAVPEEADGQRAGQSDALTYAEMESERDRLAGELYEAQTRLATYENTITWNTTCHNCATVLDSSIRETERAEQAEADRDRLAAQVAHYRRVVEAAKAWRAARPGPWVSGTDVEFHLFAAVDALPDVEPHQHECACNRNWGGPCGPCVCEEPPRQGVWRLICGAENIPPNQTYATKGAAEDVMRLHDGACPGTHGVEFVPDAGTDQTEDEIDVHL